ncbi:WYL domain-containing protein [Leifsonia sp. YIM 134122]|uniref:WYL domain-containing protein n=1 Tax=Leifsonia stereocauli TaxID=3134136 RepID=A0ABU9W8G3_9MICO
MTTPASTTARLLRLLSLLQTRRDWPGTVLADRLQISHRTVRRDVDRLRDLGYSIRATMGPDGGYRLDAGSDLPPLLFDDEQAIAVTVALQAATETNAGIEEAALRALATVRQVMPSRLRHRLDAIRFTTLHRPGDAAPVTASPEVLIALSTAVRAREVLRFDYASRDPSEDDADASPRAPRRVEPHGVVTSEGRWHLLAWDLERDDWRIFRADRISPRTPTGPRFNPREIPGGSASAYLSARFRGSDAADTWPCRGTVILDLPASEVLPFAGDGTVEALTPNRCSLEIGSWSWGALAAAFGRFEVAMEVVGPPELATAFEVLAARYAATATYPPTPLVE